jgi:hypothetical protein
MERVLKIRFTRKVQSIFWVYLYNNYFISNFSDFRKHEPNITCRFIPITFDNYHLVRDFREESRILEYNNKLVHGEIGFFTEHGGHMAGSIWASINNSEVEKVVRKYFRLMPWEGLIHDIVASERFRGKGIGPFMVSRIAPVLLRDYGLKRIVIDVSIRNRASLRMMDKIGLRINNTTLNISAFGKLIFHLVLRKYA